MSQRYGQELNEIHRSFPYAQGLPRQLDVDYKMPMNDAIVQRLTDFIRSVDRSLEGVGLKGAVVGLSGGIDSVTSAMLALRALGRDRVCLVIVEAGPRGEPRAEQVADTLGCEVIRVPRAGSMTSYGVDDENTPWFFQLNAETRAIQSVLFEVADARGCWVVSTLDLSEKLLGRHTEFFYGHGEPLADLYKSEVYGLAKYLGAPNVALTSEPGCDGWMLDIDLFGTTYDVIDPVLHLLVDRRMDPEDVARNYRLPYDWVRGLSNRIAAQRPRVSTRALVGLRLSRHQDTKQDGPR